MQEPTFSNHATLNTPLLAAAKRKAASNYQALLGEQLAASSQRAAVGVYAASSSGWGRR
jgi:hypothetical protein